MLDDACLSNQFWAEAVNTAVYLKNISPTKALSNRTPYETWHGQKRTLKHLRVFGCLAFVHEPDERRKKLDYKQ